MYSGDENYDDDITSGYDDSQDWLEWYAFGGDEPSPRERRSGAYKKSAIAGSGAYEQ